MLGTPPGKKPDSVGPQKPRYALSVRGEDAGSQAGPERRQEVTALTCKGQAGLAADDGPESVGGEALIRPGVPLFVQMADSEVASGKAVVKSVIEADFCAVQFPPKKIKNKIKTDV